MTEQELKIITDLYGNICDYSPSDEYMMEYCQRWCDENCGKVEDWQCLQKYIEEKKNEHSKKTRNTQ